jgi:DNA-binding CsgD family transcriptional regulator/DNA-binding Xre family transcriptional regulator
VAIVHRPTRSGRTASLQQPSNMPATFVPPRATLVAMPSLSHWRIARALTQEDLAERAGLNRVTVGRLETGTPARMTTVRRLAEALQVEPADLMSSLLRAFDDDSGLSPAAPMVKDAPSERELEVLRLMSEGLDNAQIAERLFIRVNTVKSHALHLMNKLDASNRMHLVARARQLRLLS